MTLGGLVKEYTVAVALRRYHTSLVGGVHALELGVSVEHAHARLTVVVLNGGRLDAQPLAAVEHRAYL